MKEISDSIELWDSYLYLSLKFEKKNSVLIP
jgi:hypothetical protein